MTIAPAPVRATAAATSPAHPDPDARPHGDIDCVDTESLLHAATMENHDLRATVHAYTTASASNLHEIESLRLDAVRLRHLIADLNDKANLVSSERDSLREQVTVLSEELKYAEKAATPEGTLLYASLPLEQVTQIYRQASRIARGPLPPAVLAEIDRDRDRIVADMTEAGTHALTLAIRRVVRRRRAAAAPSARRRTSRTSR